jgi:NADH dehydrogenase/NADH:ubiquinone oxidoreductase subunit G
LQQVVRSLDTTGAFRVERVAGEIPLAGVPGLALREERAPNAAGARLLGFSEEFDDAVSTVDGAALMIVLGDDLRGLASDIVARAARLIYLGTALPDVARTADVVLPIGNTAEEEGTFVNCDNRVQRYHQAKPAPGMARPAWWVLGELLHELEVAEPLSGAAEAFERLAASTAPFDGLSYETLGLRGAELRTERTAEVGR